MDDFASQTFRATQEQVRAGMGRLPVWQRLLAWVLLVALIGLGVILLATSIVVGGFVVLAVAAIVGVRMLWRRITGAGRQGRENVRVIVRR